MTDRIRTQLRINAVVSFASGILLAGATATVAEWLGVTIDGWLRLLGVALVGHGVFLWWASLRQDGRFWTRVNLGLIAPYPVLMVTVVVFGLVDRPLGQAIVLLDGVVVAVMAVAQWSNLRRSPVATTSQRD